MAPRVDPWAVAALGLGTLSFLALPYTLYLLAVVTVAAVAGALVFLLLSPLILAVQYLRYRRAPLSGGMGGN